MAATVRVLAFAMLRDVLGFASRDVPCADGMTIASVWDRLVDDTPGLAGYRASTRFACNGRLAERDTALHDGDELALLPPVGGG